VRTYFAYFAVVALGLLAGCLPTGPSVPPQQFFVLSDLAKPAAGQRSAQGAGRALLLNPTVTSSFYDTQSLVYSRAAGQRSYYQFANWTERPGRRFSELLMRRLEARGAFASVASTTAGVKGDVIVNTRLDELYQDASASPGRVVLEVTAEIVDYTERTVVARRRFSQSVATGGDNAAAAVAAFNQATTTLLDEVSAWIEGAGATKPQAR
jgi:cholesterol transport system auxiliary component